MFPLPRLPPDALGVWRALDGEEQRVPPMLRAMFWRVANFAGKRERRKESRVVPVPVLDLGFA